MMTDKECFDYVIKRRDEELEKKRARRAGIMRITAPLCGAAAAAAAVFGIGALAVSPHNGVTLDANGAASAKDDIIAISEAVNSDAEDTAVPAVSAIPASCIFDKYTGEEQSVIPYESGERGYSFEEFGGALMICSNNGLILNGATVLSRSGDNTLTSVYAADLNSDGFRDVCATYECSAGDIHTIVVDMKNNDIYAANSKVTNYTLMLDDESGLMLNPIDPYTREPVSEPVTAELSSEIYERTDFDRTAADEAVDFNYGYSFSNGVRTYMLKGIDAEVVYDKFGEHTLTVNGKDISFGDSISLYAMDVMGGEEQELLIQRFVVIDEEKAINFDSSSFDISDILCDCTIETYVYDAVNEELIPFVQPDGGCYGIVSSASDPNIPIIVEFDADHKLVAHYGAEWFFRDAEYAFR